MTGALLAGRDLTIGYGDLAAVQGVSVEVGGGEIVALFGPNGAGKSTTMLGLAGVLPCMSGEVSWLEKPIGRSLTRLARQGLLLVPEGRTITTRLSVRDNLDLGRGGVAAAIELFPELRPLLDRPAGLLSGGEQQILALGRALAATPKALLVDELSLGLAPLVVDRLLTTLRRAADDRGVGVLLVEQQARRALTVADRWYLLASGKIVAEGTRAGGLDALEQAYLATMTAPPSGPAGGG